MKTITCLIKPYFFIIVACLLLVFSGGKSKAITVILGSGGLTNFVVNVPTNEMMIVRAASLDGFASDVYITSGGVSYTPNGANAKFDTSLQPHYLAGPCTFLYTNSGMPFGNSVFDYDIVPCSGVETLVATNTPVIQVPAGERLDVLDGSYPVNLVVTLTNGASSQVSLCPPSLQSQDPVTGISNPHGFEVAGPLTVTVYGSASPPYSNNSPYYLTYFFASDVVQVAGPAIQSPVGSLVTVEESTDLQIWFPTYVATQTSAPKMFYRLQVVQ